jgi:hypothetical protein
MKATKDQAIKHYFEGKDASSICHIAESFYLVGFAEIGLKVWNEQTDQQVFQISQDRVILIKRILSTKCFIIKTHENGLNSLTIKNLKKA